MDTTHCKISYICSGEDAGQALFPPHPRYHCHAVLGSVGDALANVTWPGASRAMEWSGDSHLIQNGGREDVSCGGCESLKLRSYPHSLRPEGRREGGREGGREEGRGCYILWCVCVCVCVCVYECDLTFHCHCYQN